MKCYTSVASKSVKSRMRKVLGANSYVCRSYSGKASRGEGLPPSSPFLSFLVFGELNNMNMIVDMMQYMEKDMSRHDRRVNFEGGCRINVPKGTNALYIYIYIYIYI